MTCESPASAPRLALENSSGVGKDRLYRVRRAACAHCVVPSALRRAGRLADRGRVRRRHRRDQSSARSGVHSAGDLLRVAVAWPGWGTGRRGLLHRPGTGADPGAGSAVPRYQYAAVAAWRGRRGGSSCCRCGGPHCCHFKAESSTWRWRNSTRPRRLPACWSGAPTSRALAHHYPLAGGSRDPRLTWQIAGSEPMVVAVRADSPLAARRDPPGSADRQCVDHDENPAGTDTGRPVPRGWPTLMPGPR